MCGRFTLTDDGSGLAEQLGFTFLPADFTPRYNVAPGQSILAARDAMDGRRGAMLRWGLVPSWASDPKIGYKMINARAETVGERPSFRQAFEKRRCIIPADGFYEWRRESGRSQPYFFQLKNRQLFAMAGLFEGWRPKSPSPNAQTEPTLWTCTVITTEANDVVGPIHHRMPVVLTGNAIDQWLDPALPGREVASLLRPFPDEAMTVYRVSSRVNTPKNDDPQCIVPEPIDCEPTRDEEGLQTIDPH